MNRLGLICVAFFAMVSGVRAADEKTPAAAPPAPPPDHAAPASRWTPLQLAFGPFQVFPREYAVYGLGVDAFVGSVSERVVGLQTGFTAGSTKSLTGFQAGLVGNRATEKAMGVQVGCINQADSRLFGLQVGFANNPDYLESHYGTRDGMPGTWSRDTGNNLCNSWGVQVAALSNGGSSMAGVQIAGCFSLCNVIGLQIGGVGSGGSITGLQMGGVVADDNGGVVHGVQLAGMGSRAKRMNGLQVGGVLTESKAVARGVQLSGLINRAGAMNGVQVGVCFNKADHARGLQLGLFNRCNTLSGMQFGLWNRCGRWGWPLLRIGFGEPAPAKTAVPPSAPAAS